MACGTTYPAGSDGANQALLCCIHDPRACPNPKHAINGMAYRTMGGWCAWCGDPTPHRQSFCGKPCSTSYARDVGLTWRDTQHAAAHVDGFGVMRRDG